MPLEGILILVCLCVCNKTLVKNLQTAESRALIFTRWCYIPNIKALDLVILDEIFLWFPYITYVKHVKPGAGPFWPQMYNLNKIVRGPLDDATYQNCQGSKPNGFRFFFMFSLYKPL